MFNNGGQTPAYGNEKTPLQVSLEKRLRICILENEGDREDIYSDVLRLINPLLGALVEISEPSGPFSKDPLTHANNTIQNCKNVAMSAIESLSA